MLNLPNIDEVKQMNQTGQRVEVSKPAEPVHIKYYSYKLFNAELHGNYTELNITINDRKYIEEVNNGVVCTESEVLKNWLCHSGWQLIESKEILDEE
jgi:hypothetical protein